PQDQLDQLGAQAFVEMKGSQRLSTDRAQNAYVNCVVQAVVRELPADQRAIAWEAAVFADDTPNAFALPGGKVGVNTGILGVARDHDPLAAGIAHEIGHVIARHHVERSTRQYGAAGALQVVGGLLGARYGEGVGQAAMQGGSIAARSEEHTSELQSRENLVCRLLLEKKKKRTRTARRSNNPEKYQNRNRRELNSTRKLEQDATRKTDEML